MPNEQTSVPLYAASEVLTAANMNISAGTGVPVFATTATRDAAFGGSNKALAEGQLCYLESTNVVQQYNGTAWETVGPSVSGLVPIIPTSVAVGSGSGSFDATTGTVTFSGASSVSTNGVFTATYANYMIVNTVLCASGGVYGTLRMRAAGTDVTSSTYKYGQSFINATSAGFEVGSASATNMQITTLGTTSGQIIIYINSPFLAVETGLFANAQGNTTFTAAFGQQTGSTSFDGFTFGSASSTITGKLTVFGIKQ